MGLKSRGEIPTSEQQFRTEGRHLMLLKVEQLIYGSEENYTDYLYHSPE